MRRAELVDAGEASAEAVSARIERLISRYHDSDRTVAARRLGIEPKILEGLLSGDWRRFSLDGLIAVIRTHRVTVDWLVGSESGGWPEVALGSVWSSDFSAAQARAPLSPSDDSERIPALIAKRT
jgi:hypothetical protein